MTKVLTVNYNTPNLVIRLITSLRQYHNNEILIVDGSNKYNYEKLKHLAKDLLDIEIHHFGYNIHHGPGLAYGITHLNCNKIMVFDSDVIVHGKVIELLERNLKPDEYGIGEIQFVNNDGWNIGDWRYPDFSKEGIKYLHPACMLINRKIALQYALPIKHGAPVISTMIDIKNKGMTYLLNHSEEIHQDMSFKVHKYIEHNFQGTVKLTGGYNL